MFGFLRLNIPHRGYARARETAEGSPAIDLNALGIGFASVSEFLAIARAFEDVGVTAYGGSAPLIFKFNHPGLRRADSGFGSGALGEHPLADRSLRNSDDPADILPPPSGAKFFSNDSNALTVTRTPGQVLYIAYGGMANVIYVGFFPNGVNGTLNMSSAPA
jgi:hypothetical protein